VNFDENKYISILIEHMLNFQPIEEAKNQMTDNIPPKFAKLALDVLESNEVKTLLNEWKDLNKSPNSKAVIK
jgi:hypothetical protein